MNSTLFLLVIVLLIFFIALIFFVTQKGKKRFSAEQKRTLLKEIQELSNNTNSKNPSVRRDLIIKADTILTKTLQIYYKNKESCGNNLKQAKNLFNKEQYNEIWTAHKMRNDIVHSNKEVNVQEATNSYKILSKAVNKLINT